MQVNCPICSGQSVMLFKTMDMNRRLSDEVFNYFWCKACGVIFIYPVPKNLNEYYPDDYDFHILPSSHDKLLQSAHDEQYKIDIVQNFISTGRLLEVGPGIGYFAVLAKQAGYDVSIIDMNKECCQFLNKVAGIHSVHSNDPNEAIRQMKEFDVIALWHVIEHIPDPYQTLISIASHLSPNGIVVIAAPNPESMQFKIFQRKWAHVAAPRHLQLIPISTLIKIGSEFGLTPRMITTRDRGTIRWNLFGWQWSLKNHFGHEFFPYGVRVVGRILNALFSPIERTNLRGSCYTLVLQNSP